jgi:hypothetical protein
MVMRRGSAIRCGTGVWRQAEDRMRRLTLALFLLGTAIALPAGAADQSEVARIFRDNFIPKFNESCIGSAKQDSEGRFSDAKIAAYCSCAAKRMSALDDAEKQELMQTGAPPSPPLQQKMNDLVAQCGSETLR